MKAIAQSNLIVFVITLFGLLLAALLSRRLRIVLRELVGFSPVPSHSAWVDDITMSDDVRSDIE
jgi:hypothetical protein